MENETMHVKISFAMTNIIYLSAQPRDFKNTFRNLHTL